MNKTIKILSLLSTYCIFSLQVSAVDIDLTIVGDGKVSVSETSVECTESCTINNTDQINTLVATADTNERFIGWTGQQCDSGNQVLVDQNFNLIHKVSDGAKTLVSADVDNDSKIDLAAISLFDGQINLLVNQGGGSFDATLVASDLSYPSALDFFDWDNDGDQDLLVAEYGARVIKMYLNDGNGSFVYQNDIALGDAKVYAIAVADVNGDDHPDIVASSFMANIDGNLQTLVDSIKDSETRWFLNDGNDSFSASTLLSNTAAITLDVHKNETLGSIDVVAAEIESGDVAVYRLISGAVSREFVVNSQGAYGVAFSDIDNNGYMDVLSTHYSPSKAKLTYGYEDGTFLNEHTIMSFSEGVTATAFIDVNDDNYLDLMIGEFNTGEFGYIETTSYLDCVVSSANSISITANFSTSTTPVSPPATPPKNSDSSGGGSFGFEWLIIAILTRLRYRK